MNDTYYYEWMNDTYYYDWMNDKYYYESSVCRAAIHANIISDDGGSASIIFLEAAFVNIINFLIF